MLKNLFKLGLSMAALYALRKIYKKYKTNGGGNLKDLKDEIMDFILKNGLFNRGEFKGQDYKKDRFDDFGKKNIVDEILSFLDADSRAQKRDYVEYIKVFKRVYSTLSDVKNFPYSYNVSYLKHPNFNTDDMNKANKTFKDDLDCLYDFMDAHIDDFETLVARKNDFNAFNTSEKILFENLYLAYGAVIGMMDNRQEYTNEISKQLRNMLVELQERMES